MAIEKKNRTRKIANNTLEFRPLTTKTWPDIEELLGSRGGWGGCWCMWWRLDRATFQKHRGQRNKQSLHRVVASGQPVGVLAYSAGRPVGWCAVAPREVYTRLETSRVLKAVDAQPVWSVSCFFVKPECRRAGLSVALLKAGVDYAIQNGAKIIEGYPYEPRKNLPDAFAWTGLLPTFCQAGFEEVMRRSRSRPIMRKSVSA